MTCSDNARASRSLVVIALVFATIAVLGCGGGDATRPPPTSPPPPPPDVWRSVAGRSWTMPGESEGYVCFVVHLASDEYLTGFRLVSPNPAQKEVVLTVSDVPVTEGSFACDPGSVATHLIYAASGATSPIEFPAGFGVHVPAGQYVWLNIHLSNTTDTSVTDSTSVEARIGTAADVATPIDMLLAGTFLINIPADGVLHTATGTCTVAADNHLLAFLPLIRAAGRHQLVSLLSDTTTATLLDEDFDLQHDDYSQPATPIAVKTGDQLRTVCSYVNIGGATLNYGESSHNESCFAAIYRYPTSATSTLFDCAEGHASFDVKRE